MSDIDQARRILERQLRRHKAECDARVRKAQHVWQRLYARLTDMPDSTEVTISLGLLRAAIATLDEYMHDREASDE